jgi:NAD(P)H dehydrogenase (quinone)
MIAITAATGQLGQLVIEQLLQKVPPSKIVAVVRNPDKASALAARGIAVRTADYGDLAALESAFSGISKVLLISGTEFGQRARQHANVVTAAKKAGVSLFVYTSLLRADTTKLGLGPEHLETEKIIRASGLPFVILRNGWYTENYAASAKPAVANGAFLGSARAGRISGASRADYAAAAVAALTGRAEPGRVYELAGDIAFTLADLAAEISRQTGKTIPYRDLPETDFAAILRQIGLPSPLADLLASSDVAAADGALFDDTRQLSRLIGRPTTPLAEAVRTALL